MVDPIQVFFIVITTTLTVLLVIVGIEAYKVLKQIQKSIKRADKIMDDVEIITESVAGPVEKLSGLVHGLQHGATFINTIQSIIERRNQQEQNRQ